MADRRRINLGGFRRREDGQVLVLVALAFLPVMGAAGLAVETGRVDVARAQVQSAVDAASLAGVGAIRDGGHPVQVARAYALANDPAGAGVLHFTTRCLSSVGVTCVESCECNAVQVTQDATIPSSFAGVFGITSLHVAAVTSEAVADRPTNRLVPVSTG